MSAPSHSPLVASSPTWSVSRDQLLQICERKFFFQYLAGARLNGDTPEQRQTALLKKLKTVPMWLGDCFHSLVADYLSAVRDRAAPTRAVVLDALRQRIERDWRFSAQGRFRTQPYQIDKSGVALVEHYYSQMPADTNAAWAYGQAEPWMVRFLTWAEASGVLREVEQADRIWIEPPPWGEDAPGFLEQDVQIVTKVDFAWERAGEGFVIYDWKASAPPRSRPPFLSQHELQVGVYQLWPHLTLGIDLDLIQSRLVYVGGDSVSVETNRLDPETLPLVRSTLRDSVRLGLRWAERVDSGEVQLPELSYAATISACRQCGFRELCRRDVTK